MAFAHLHTHTEYSPFDGANKVNNYVERVKELGMTACAATEHGNLGSYNLFYKKCKSEGIKPILGIEAYCNPRGREYRMHEFGDDNNYHLILLAKDNEGLHNLFKLSSEAWISGFYKKPRVDDELLYKYRNGIIASSACLGGQVAKELIQFGYERGKKTALKYKEIFGADFYLELQYHGIPDQEIVNNHLIKMSQETGIPLIATNDCHYTWQSSHKAHDILMCMQFDKTINEERDIVYTDQFYVKNEEEMRALGFPSEAYDNTQKIADMCEAEVEHGKLHFPVFNDVPEGKSHTEYFRELAYEGLDKLHKTEEMIELAKKKTDEEIKVIDTMGYVDYFLIVRDYIIKNRELTKEEFGPVLIESPGRGSVGGANVAYGTEISHVDPIKYNTIFSRFLNEDKKALPDLKVKSA